MSESKFKVGDRVRLKNSGAIVEVAITKDGFVSYGEEVRIVGSCPEEDVEPIDSKTAFLSELKELLSKYDAMIIGGGYDGYGDYLKIKFGLDEPFDVGECSEYGDRCTLTADNIMDYKKTDI